MKVILFLHIVIKLTMFLNNGEVLHFAQAVIAVSAQNSILRLAVAVMAGVTIIQPHLSKEGAARRESASSSSMSTKCFSLPFQPFCFLCCVAFTVFQAPFLSVFTFYLNPYNNPLRQKYYSHLTDEENKAQKGHTGQWMVKLRFRRKPPGVHLLTPP